MKLNGEIEMHILEEKIRFLKLKIAEKQRQIHVAQQLLPAKRSLDADLAVLQIQVGRGFMRHFLGLCTFYFLLYWFGGHGSSYMSIKLSHP